MTKPQINGPFQHSLGSSTLVVGGRGAAARRLLLRSIGALSAFLGMVLASSSSFGQVTITIQAVALPAQPPNAVAEEKPGDLPDDVFAPVPKKKEPKALAHRRMAFVAGPGMDLDPLIQRFLPQFRQLTKVQIHLVHSVCNLSKEQKKKLDLETLTAAKAAAKQYAEFQQKMMQGQWNGTQSYPEPRALVQDSLTPILKANLTDDQYTRFTAEMRRRKEDRKLVTIQNLVARLDEELILTGEQRQKLTDSLAKHWQEAWEQSLEMFQYNTNGIPNVPDQNVIPFLNKTQISVWHGIQRNNAFYWGGFGIGGAMLENDFDIMSDDVEVHEDKAPAQAKKR